MAFWKAGFGSEEEDKSEISIVKEVVPSAKPVKTVFAAGAFVEGKLSFETDVQIDGHVRGSITAQNLLVVGRTGQLEAELDVGELVVEGIVIGRIRVRSHVHIASTGKVLGDITCSQISIEKGAIFKGQCLMEVENDLR
ncbi:MAG: polymer-forming cytoskeletal protein [Deltaproteobacteria bacterium]|nr:polymer-forming cytoskeletal protein [Deltaproteobacteria bacterium]